MMNHFWYRYSKRMSKLFGKSEVFTDDSMSLKLLQKYSGSDLKKRFLKYILLKYRNYIVRKHGDYSINAEWYKYQIEAPHKASDFEKLDLFNLEMQRLMRIKGYKLGLVVFDNYVDLAKQIDAKQKSRSDSNRFILSMVITVLIINLDKTIQTFTNLYNWYVALLKQ